LRERLTEFEAHRTSLFALAYRMLGSAADAQDVLQDAYLRYQAVPAETIRTPKALLGTIVTRLCLNQLEAARIRRRTYPGPWFPEPIRTESAGLNGSTSERIEMLESISLAFLTMLERLTASERAVFLLHRVFGFSYAEIATMVGKDAAACRQIGSRAAKHVAAHRPRHRATPDQHRRLLAGFMGAIASGSYDALVELLTDDVTLAVDGGGKVRGAATRPLHGPTVVARFLVASTRLLPDQAVPEVADVNGAPTLLLRVGDRVAYVIAIDPREDRIAQVRVLANPDKLRWLDAPASSPTHAAPRPRR
jgi:RNA polymerase sigma-70 factor, ECF subfamily